ncbi:hypothetical protein MTP99_005953 [Tenebrio molitor]|nr:hypothetical protein MTP99_005953 [Tenebrio molitor]
MRQHFWNRWCKEYVGQLQERPKWQKGNSSAAIKEGDLVVLKESTPPLTWKLGRVIAVHPGPDDIIRVATLKTDSGTQAPLNEPSEISTILCSEVVQYT